MVITHLKSVYVIQFTYLHHIDENYSGNLRRGIRVRGAHTRSSRQMKYYNLYIYIRVLCIYIYIYILTTNHDKVFVFKTVPFA